jgi:polo-like kinase 1
MSLPSSTFRPLNAIPGSERAKEIATSQKCPIAKEVPAVIECLKRDYLGNEVKKRYTKGVLLGKGGFAKCFQVKDMDTGKDWACKVVQKASLVKERHKLKLQAEIKIHKSLKHQYIVQFEDVFEDADHVYILMELCPNQTMMELVKRKKRLTENETRRYIVQLVSN